MTEYLKALSAPFPPHSIHWRIGAKGKDNTAIALSYLDARDVMDRLDDVCGPENWQCKYSHAAQKTVCELAVKVDGEWVTKANGAGDSDIEGEKGALSDAFKRAAVLWGIGRYLYSLKSPWVKLTQNGRAILQSEMPKLERLLGTDSSEAPPINLDRSKGREPAKPASPNESPIPDSEAVDSFWEQTSYTIDARNLTVFDKEFRSRVSEAVDVDALNKLRGDNLETLETLKSNFSAIHKIMAAQWKQKLSDLSQREAA